MNAGADLTNPQTWNGYSYVRNNPLALVDPSGMDAFDPGDPGDCDDDPDCSWWDGGWGPPPNWDSGSSAPPPPPPIVAEGQETDRCLMDRGPVARILDCRPG